MKKKMLVMLLSAAMLASLPAGTAFAEDAEDAAAEVTTAEETTTEDAAADDAASAGAEADLPATGGVSCVAAALGATGIASLAVAFINRRK